MGFRFTFAKDWGETLRASVIFGTLLLVIVGIAVQLTFRELSLKVLTARLDLGRSEALRIARAVELLGRQDGVIDFSQVRENREPLRRYINHRIAEQFFISFVEVRDRFGGRQLLVLRGEEVGPRFNPRPPRDWPSGSDQVVAVPLRPGAGEVRIGVSKEAVLEELQNLQDSLRLQVIAAAAVALTVLIAGLIYVLYLIRKNRRLEQARQSAGRASYVGLLASGLAHEIRNPLNAMNMNLQMLEEELEAEPGFDQSEHNELLESTKREIKRLERLVNNFLIYARPAQPRFESKDLNRVVTDVVRFLEADFRKSGVAVRLDQAQLLPNVEIDETQLRQALINLLVNARQVLKDKGTVSVRTRTGSGGEVVLEISDDGPGIKPEVRDRIFEVFYSSRGGGTGLGLPIARQIVERHGGVIEMETAEGRGTTFRIRLPRRQASAVRRPPALQEMS